jgi:hypothetical protein
MAGFLMQLQVTRKFPFRIRTRAGLVVDSLLIPGRDVADAERKVHQLYRDCVILENQSSQAEASVSGSPPGTVQRQYG